MVETESSIKGAVMQSNDVLKQAQTGFSVSNCPLWVYKGIAEPAGLKFNGTYWIRIAELLQIEEAYYNLVSVTGASLQIHDTNKSEVLTDGMQRQETTKEEVSKYCCRTE